MAYIITKVIDGKFTYYLGKDGKWEGLKDNGKRNYDYKRLSNDLLLLRARNINCKINFIDIE